MAAPTAIISLVTGDMGSMPNRPVCVQTESAVTNILQLETGPISEGDGRLISEFDRGSELCISPLYSNSQSDIPDSQTTGGGDSGDPPVEIADLVPNIIGDELRPPQDASVVADATLGPHGEHHPMVISGQLSLMAWRLSGNSGICLDFWIGLQNSSNRPGPPQLGNNTLQLGKAGFVGAWNGTWIPWGQSYPTL